jgi:hypothetical protein
MRDISIFTSNALGLLLSVPRDVIHFKLERNSPISFIYFDLLLCYMRILMLFSSIQERNNIYILYRTACQFQPLLTTGTGAENHLKLNFNEINTLLSSTNNIQNYFITVFKPITLFLSPMLLQFQNPLLLSHNIDLLKSKNSFNITTKENDKKNIYNDLLYISKYKEYVVFGFLACPELLLQVFIYFFMGGLFWLFIFGLFFYICIFYYLYVDSLTYPFGWSAFLCRIRFCDTLSLKSFLSTHHHHYHSGTYSIYFN